MDEDNRRTVDVSVKDLAVVARVVGVLANVVEISRLSPSHNGKHQEKEETRLFLSRLSFQVLPHTLTLPHITFKGSLIGDSFILQNCLHDYKLPFLGITILSQFAVKK